MDGVPGRCDIYFVYNHRLLTPPPRGQGAAERGLDRSDRFGKEEWGWLAGVLVCLLRLDRAKCRKRVWITTRTVVLVAGICCIQTCITVSVVVMVLLPFSHGWCLSLAGFTRCEVLDYIALHV